MVRKLKGRRDAGRELRPGVREYSCPACRLAIVFDDNRRVSAHQAPVCNWWGALMDQFVAEGHTKAIGAELIEGAGVDDGEPSN